jgi:GAF domain-containing protein
MNSSALARLSELLREQDDPRAAVFAAAQLLGEALGVSRVGFGTIDPLTQALWIERDWCMPGVESFAGISGLRGYLKFIEDLQRNRAVSVSDVRDDDRTASAAAPLEAAGIRAFVDVPATEQGRLVALLYVHHHEPRTWSASDLAFVREATDRIHAALHHRLAAGSGGSITS